MAQQTDFNRVGTLLQKTVRDSNLWTLQAAETSSPLTISFLNAHGINNAVSHTEFYNSLMESDYLLRDGIGVKLALKFFKLGDTANLNGTDLISKILTATRGKKMAIFGASDEALKACRNRLEKEGFQNIVAMENGFHQTEFYLDICNTIKPDVIVLCMGMPKQEILAHDLRKAGFARMIICGGGWVDFYSGHKTRAPEWVRKLSLEWVHRLVKEPKRLGKRYTIDILYYFYVLAVARVRGAA